MQLWTAFTIFHNFVNGVHNFSQLWTNAPLTPKSSQQWFLTHFTIRVNTPTYGDNPKSVLVPEVYDEIILTSTGKILNFSMKKRATATAEAYAMRKELNILSSSWICHFGSAENVLGNVFGKRSLDSSQKIWTRTLFRSFLRTAS